MKRWRVLVVDDDPAVVAAVRAVLAPEGYEVAGETDPARALTSILREAPDVLVLDVNMPVLNGWELCEIVRRQSRTEDLPILFLTGRSEVRDQITSMQSGGTDHLAKPFQAGELRRRVRALLSREPGRAR